MELVRNLRVDSVSRLEPTPPRQVESTQTVAEAVELMSPGKSWLFARMQGWETGGSVHGTGYDLPGSGRPKSLDYLDR